MKQRPKTTADIGNFDNVRWEDQKEIQKKIGLFVIILQITFINIIIK